EQWGLLQCMEPIFKILNKATNWISTSKYPTLHQVIPTMDILNDMLEKEFNDTARPAVIHRAIQRGIIVLDKYYSLTDDSIMWKTAMLLHPRYHEKWFHNAKWEGSWVDTAVREAHRIWTQAYKTTIT
ncbi:hypothetical protein BDP27DRAFT_1195606, partial [Rhodocollybia butyracea]